MSGLSNKEFLADAEVQDFICWLANKSDNIDVELDIKRPKIQTSCRGLESVLGYYKWGNRDWTDTKTYLESLGEQLHLAISNNANEEAKSIIYEIFNWGRAGKIPNLVEKNLCKYVENCLNIIDSNVISEANLQSVKYMNSMWAKVYAISSATGAPIYDSRVGAAVCALVAFWECERGNTASANLEFFVSPPRGNNPERRKEIMLYKEIKQFAPMTHNAKDKPKWLSCMVRLSWIMEEVLKKNKNLFANEGSIEARKHAFEASLFMVGYDVKQIKQ